MKGLWVGKAYGVAIAVLCAAMAACAPDTSLQTPPDQTAITLNSRSGPLSRQQIIRALAARGRAARQGTKPGETIMRVFDRNGKVISESVLSAKGWLLRPSTLTTAIANQPLASFVPTGFALYDTTTTTLQPQAYPYTDTLTPTATVHAKDSVWTIPASTIQVATHDGDRTDDVAYDADVYYTDVAHTGHTGYSTSAVVIASNPLNDAEYDEFDIQSGTWSTAVATAATMLGTSLRAQPTSVAPPISADPAGSGITMYTGPHANTQADPCSAERNIAVGAIALTASLAIAGGILSFFSAGFFAEVAAPQVIWGAKASALALSAWAACRALNQIAALDHGSDATVKRSRLEQRPLPDRRSICNVDNAIRERCASIRIFVDGCCGGPRRGEKARRS